MGRKGKSRRNSSVERHPPGPAPAPAESTSKGWFVPFVLGAVLTASFAFAIAANQPFEQPTTTRSVVLEPGPLSLGELALMSAEELEKQDLALLNLRCAEGLSGSKGLDVEKCLATLDRWADKVRLDTERHLYKFAQSPEEYDNSMGYFRMLMLITVVQQDFGVHYNPERIREIDFTKSSDLFLHGLVGKDNGGTCVSMPVLYTAVAQRLGYPVYLVSANAHLFCRWDEPGDRFNIEATSQGMNRFDDDYYRTWPKPITKAQVEKGWFLKSLDHAESFAAFLAARGHCLEDNGDAEKARVAYALAAEKHPSVPIYRGFLAQTMNSRAPSVARSRGRSGLGLPPTASASYPTGQRSLGLGPQPRQVAKPSDPFVGAAGPTGFNNPTSLSNPAPAGFGIPPQ